MAFRVKTTSKVLTQFIHPGTPEVANAGAELYNPQQQGYSNPPNSVNQADNRPKGDSTKGMSIKVVPSSLPDHM